jgi:hypothetical protein
VGDEGLREILGKGIVRVREPVKAAKRKSKSHLHALLGRRVQRRVRAYGRQ